MRVANSAEAAVKVITGNIDGWVRLGNGPQDLRTWAMLCAVKAAFKAGHDPNATIGYQQHVSEEAGNVHYDGVQWVFMS